MKVKIGNHKSCLYQWDTGQFVVIDGVEQCNEIHFCNDRSKNALVVKIADQDGKRIANIPNILLQNDGSIYAYLFARNEDGSETRTSASFPVRGRKKPESYVYTETERWTYDNIERRLDDLEDSMTHGTVKSINGLIPDANGNVEIEIPEGITGSGVVVSETEPEDTSVLWVDTDEDEVDNVQDVINEALAQAKASGEFKGEPGYTPVKGVDYFDGDDYTLTDADKTEIAELAAEMVDVPEGGDSALYLVDAQNPNFEEAYAAYEAGKILQMTNLPSNDSYTVNKDNRIDFYTYIQGTTFGNVTFPSHLDFFGLVYSNTTGGYIEAVTGLNSNNICSIAYQPLRGYLTEHQDISGKADKTQVATYITPEMHGAKGNGSTDDSAAIQAAIDAAGSENIVYLAKKTYKISTGLAITHSRRKFVCDGTISYSGSGAAITIGSKNIDVSVAEIAAPNGTAVKVEGANKYIEQCNVKVGSVTSSKIGLHLRTDTISITYNRFCIDYISASEIGVYVECNASYINENWYHLGKITGCKTGVKLYSDSSLSSTDGFGTNDNRFRSGSFEGIASDGCAIFIQNSSGNKFANFRCAENYGKNMVVIKGYSKGNDIDLSRVMLCLIDVSEHTGGDNNIFRSAVVGDEVNGFYCGTEARLDEISGITYDSRYAKVSQEVGATTFENNIIVPVNRMILNSLYFSNENINGLTFTMGHVYSHTSSMSRGNPAVLVFSESGGRVLLKDMNGDAILDNTNGEFAGKTVTIKWDGIDKTNNKNIWSIVESGKLPLYKESLNAAIDDALAQAKAGGQFKGDPGEPGADGKTPVKGEDYFTEADVQEIAEQAAELVEVPEDTDAVESVNGKTGAVELTHEDVGAQLKTLVVTLTENADGTFTASHSPAEIEAHVNAGGDSTINIDGVIYRSLGGNGVEWAYGITTYNSGIALQAIGIMSDKTTMPLNYNVKDDIPKTLPNPNGLTFTGAVTGTYDGSKPVEIEVPVIAGEPGKDGITPHIGDNGNWWIGDTDTGVSAGGSGGGTGGSSKAKTEKLLDVTFTEATASVSVTLEHNFHKLFLVWNGGENIRTVDAEGAAISSNKLGVILGSTSFSWNSRKVGVIEDSGRAWATGTLLMEWTEDLSTYLNTTSIGIGTNTPCHTYSFFGGASALLGTVVSSDAIAPASGTEIGIVLSTGFFAPNTRIVLVGEYYE